MYDKLLLVIAILLILPPAFAQDNRVKVEMPPMMRAHMLSNMRDHLLALEQITRALANREYDAAAEIAEQRLGMSSMDDHGAAHMGKVMPIEMGKIGTRMHQAASRFAIVARDAEIEGGLNAAFSALSDVMQQCVACHAGYKIH